MRIWNFDEKNMWRTEDLLVIGPPKGHSGGLLGEFSSIFRHKRKNTKERRVLFYDNEWLDLI
jgi:hypothetical protein